jgi:hypothetical protein
MILANLKVRFDLQEVVRNLEGVVSTPHTAMHAPMIAVRASKAAVRSP